MKEKKTILGVMDVAYALKVSTQTINNWYRWKNDPNTELPVSAPPLPDFVRLSNNRRKWKSTDLPALKKFAKWVPKGRAGKMGNSNFKYWGDRGTRAQENKVNESE